MFLQGHNQAIKKENNRNTTGELDLGINTRQTQHYSIIQAGRIGASTRTAQLVSKDNSAWSEITPRGNHNKTGARVTHQDIHTYVVGKNL